VRPAGLRYIPGGARRRLTAYRIPPPSQRYPAPPERVRELVEKWNAMLKGSKPGTATGEM